MDAVTSERFLGVYLQNAVQGGYLPNASSINLPWDRARSQRVEDLNRIQAIQATGQPPDIRAAEDRVDVQDAQIALAEPGEVALDQIRAKLNLPKTGDHMQRRILFLMGVFVAMLMFVQTAVATHIGGGDQNPNLETNAKALQKWQDARVGFTVHWGPVALRGTEIGWSRGGGPSWAGQVPREEYDSLYKEFNPALFDAQEWIRLLKDSGFRYVTFVSKHVDGFSMWGTKQSEYNIVNSAFHRDWLKEVSEECRRQGIMFGVYYAIPDWYQYDYSPGDVYRPPRGGPGFTLDRPPDFDRYVTYMKNQLQELIQDYGSEIILLDAGWNPPWNHDRGSDLYRYLRGLRDDIVINSRVDEFEKGGSEGAKVGENPLWVWYPASWNHEKYAGDYLEREQYIGGSAPYPWEAWITLGDQWAWKPNDKYKSAEDCIRYLVEAAGGNGNFNLNVTPMPEGRFEQRQKDILLRIGAWLKSNGESIYGTRGGPFEPGLWGASTQRHDKIFVHIVSWPGETLRLPALKQTVKSARRLHGGDVQWKQTASGLEISVPISQRDAVDTIVELTIEK